ncbi:MAG: HAMP domain-containing protein [Candidatus Omnitrophica bacterium]|nr:HAMP domain-containing protein [Candidatus Omnitrophota bacterium]
MRLRVDLHVKITFVFAVIFAVSLLGIFFYLNYNLRQYAYSRIKENLLKQTLLSQSLLEEYFSENLGYQELDPVADKISRDLGVRVTIIGLDGKVLGDSELDGETLYNVENHLYRPEVQDAFVSGTGESRRFSATVDQEMLYIASVFGSTRPEGVVRLSLPLSEIKLISARLKKILFLALIATFFLAIPVSFVALVFISRPIKEIASTARGIAGGDFSRRIWVSTNDEIGELAKTINYMSEQIKSRIEEVMSSTARLKAVLLSMFEGVMVVDGDGSILLMNHTLQNLWSINSDPAGKKPLEVIRNIEIQEITDDVLQHKRAVTTRELSIFIPQEKVLLVYATPVIRQRQIEGAVLVFHDVTELKRLERVRRDFVANVSHELRTPIASIKGYAETLLEGALQDKENAEDFVRIIYSDADRLAWLIDDILDLSKIESGKLKLDLKPCNIPPVLDRVVSGLKKYAEKNTITIEKDIPADIPAVLGDENRLAQVLLNLIDNAIKYNRKGGRIYIRARSQEKLVRIEVTDTGIGIPSSDVPRIFERFYRVDKARSRELGGTGLGLSIVKHIIVAHGGEVFVKSELGTGSTFSFTVPRV